MLAEIFAPIAGFVGNTTWITILLVVHILGAIVGIGPTFAYGFLGNAAGKEPGAAVALLSTMLEIEHKLVTPVAMVTQPLSGVLLVFASRRNEGFFQREWLVIAIVAYIVLMYLAYAQSDPATVRMVAVMKAGDAGSPAFQRDLKKTQMLGPILGILGVLIVVLMVWKPGN